MRYYETLYIINPNLTDEDCKDVVTKFNNLVEKNNGVVVNVDEWGKKSLAYEVKKFDKGYYVLMQYCGDPGITEELKTDFRMDERVLKYQTIKLSNDADPEALKQQAAETREKVGEEAAAAVEASLSEEKEEADKDQDQEGENGVR